MKEIQIIDWGKLDYAKALVRQRQMVDERIKDRSPDRLLLVEHPPVVTIGRSGSLNDLHVSKDALAERGVALQQVERGGRATFHGPGQLVAYPIVNSRRQRSAQLFEAVDRYRGGCAAKLRVGS